MIGLHKLKDIPLIGRFNNPHDTTVSTKYLMAKIKKEELTERDIKASCYYLKIAERYQQFTADNLLCMTYTDVVVDFDVTLLKKSRLVNTKYILYEEKDNAYKQLCIAPDSTIYLEDTF